MFRRLARAPPREMGKLADALVVGQKVFFGEQSHYDNGTQPSRGNL